MNTELAQMTAPPAFLVEHNLSSQVPMKSENWIGLETGYRAAGVSPRHCVIKFFEKQFYITDMGSMTGTFLNNHRLVTQQWYPLNPGDSIRVGVFAFQFSIISLAKPLSPVKAAPRETPEVKKFETHMVSAEEDNASYGTRFCASMADNLVLSMFSAAVLFVLPKSSLFSGIVGLLAYILCIAVPLVMGGQTLGKKLMGIRVVQGDGSELTAWKVFQREILIKLGVVMLAVAFIGVLSGLNPAAGGICLLVFPILLAYKTYRDGDIFWDISADTKVIVCE